MYPTQLDQRRQLKTTILLLIFANFIILCAVFFLASKAIELNAKKKDGQRLISDKVKNGLHSIVFSYRDTVALDSVSPEAYRKLVEDGILPKQSD